MTWQSAQVVLTVLAGVFSVAGYVPYVKAIIRWTNPVQPEKATWITWAILDSIIFAGMWVKHALNGQIIGTIFGVWLVAILSLKYGKSGWTMLDKFCLGGAAIGIVFLLFNNPTSSIIIGLVVVSIGSVPTFVCTWRDPDKEDKITWTIWLVACVCAMLAIPHWTIQDAVQPTGFFISVGIEVGIIYFRPRS